MILLQIIQNKQKCIRQIFVYPEFESIYFHYPEGLWKILLDTRDSCLYYTHKKKTASSLTLVECHSRWALIVPLIFVQFQLITGICRQISVNLPNTKFHETPFYVSRVVMLGIWVRWKDMVKLKTNFRKFSC